MDTLLPAQSSVMATPLADDPRREDVRNVELVRKLAKSGLRDCGSTVCSEFVTTAPYKTPLVALPAASSATTRHQTLPSLSGGKLAEYFPVRMLPDIGTMTDVEKLVFATTLSAKDANVPKAPWRTSSHARSADWMTASTLLATAPFTWTTVEALAEPTVSDPTEGAAVADTQAERSAAANSGKRSGARAPAPDIGIRLSKSSCMDVFPHGCCNWARRKTAPWTAGPGLRRTLSASRKSVLPRSAEFKKIFGAAEAEPRHFALDSGGRRG